MLVYEFMHNGTLKEHLYGKVHAFLNYNNKSFKNHPCMNFDRCIDT